MMMMMIIYPTHTHNYKHACLHLLLNPPELPSLAPLPPAPSPPPHLPSSSALLIMWSSRCEPSPRPRQRLDVPMKLR